MYTIFPTGDTAISKIEEKHFKSFGLETVLRRQYEMMGDYSGVFLYLMVIIMSVNI